MTAPITKNACVEQQLDAGNESAISTPMKEQESNPMIQNSTALDQWKSRAEAATSIDVNAQLGAFAAGRAWTDRDLDIISNTPNCCGVASAPVPVPLTRYGGSSHRSENLHPAHVDVQIVHHLKSSEPLVTLLRWEALNTGGFGEAAGSGYRLTLDEAAQLALTLTLAVDLVRGDPNGSRSR